MLKYILKDMITIVLFICTTTLTASEERLRIEFKENQILKDLRALHEAHRHKEDLTQEIKNSVIEKLKMLIPKEQASISRIGIYTQETESIIKHFLRPADDYKLILPFLGDALLSDHNFTVQGILTLRGEKVIQSLEDHICTAISQRGLSLEEIDEVKKAFCQFNDTFKRESTTDSWPNPYGDLATAYYALSIKK